MPLEDDFSDIIKKARTGLKLSVGDVARMTGLPGADVTALERGDQLRDSTELRTVSTPWSSRALVRNKVEPAVWSQERKVESA